LIYPTEILRVGAQDRVAERREQIARFIERWGIYCNNDNS